MIGYSNTKGSVLQNSEAKIEEIDFSEEDELRNWLDSKDANATYYRGLPKK